MDFLFSVNFYILFFFISLFIYLGIYNNTKNKSLTDYFSAGKNTKWYIAMLSIVATETSVITFVAIPGLAYTQQNWYFLQFPLGYIVGRILVSKFLLPLYFSKNITSIYELIGQRYNRSLQRVTSIVFLCTRVLADGVRFLATAAIVQILTGWSLEVSVLLIGCVTLLYAISGGLKAIMLIDSIQFLIYLSGGIMVILFIMFSKSFIGIESLVQKGNLDIVKFSTDSFFSDQWFFVNAFFGGLLMSFASHGVDYMMVQRVLSCKTLKLAQRAMIGSGFFVLLQFAIFLFVGSLIWQYMGEIEGLGNNEVFSTFITKHLPIWLKSIILIGVLSAAMSTLSSSINSLASSTVIDVFRGNVSLKMSKIISLFWASILIIVAIAFDEKTNESFVFIGYKIGTLTYGGLLGIFLIHYINDKINSSQIIIGLISSIMVVSYLLATDPSGEFIAWTFYILISFTIFVIMSHLAYYINLLIGKKHE